MKFEIEDHDGIDKRFGAGNDHIWMYVDYDDVNHPMVDAGINYIKQLLEKHWDEHEFRTYQVIEFTKHWNDDEYLQEGYTLEEYLDQSIV